MMALTTQLWTLNAISVELGISSRVLGRRLSDLTPDQVDQQAGRQVKSWRLARVLRHLKAADRIVGPCGATADPERARLLLARARRAELEVAALQRDLLPSDEVVEAWQQLVAAFRARCLAIPSKLAPQLAATNDRGAVQAVLTAAVREALQELSRFDLPRDRPARPRGEPPAGSNGKSRPRRAPVH